MWYIRHQNWAAGLTSSEQDHTKKGIPANGMDQKNNNRTDNQPFTYFAPPAND